MNAGLKMVMVVEGCSMYNVKLLYSISVFSWKFAMREHSSEVHRDSILLAELIRCQDSSEGLHVLTF